MKRVLMIFWVMAPLFVKAQSDSATNNAQLVKLSQPDENTYLIRANGKFDKAYNNRGLAKYLTGDKKDGCADLNKALQLGYPQAKQNLINYCK